MTATGTLLARRRLTQVHRALAAPAATESEPPALLLPPTAALPEQASLSADGLALLKDHEVHKMARFWHENIAKTAVFAGRCSASVRTVFYSSPPRRCPPVRENRTVSSTF